MSDTEKYFHTPAIISSVYHLHWQAFTVDYRIVEKNSYNNLQLKQMRLSDAEKYQHLL